MLTLYKLWIGTSVFVGLFVGSNSDIKLIGYVFFIIVTFLGITFLKVNNYFIKKLNSINVNVNAYFIGIFIFALIGFLLYWTFVSKLISPILPYNNQIYFSNGNYELMFNPLHNHILKPLLSILFNISPLKLSGSNYLSSLVFLTIYNYSSYVVLLVLYIVFCGFGLLLIIKEVKHKTTLQTLILTTLVYVMLKSVLDGGLFWVEFLTSSLLCYVIFKNLKLTLSKIFILYFLTSLIEYLLSCYIVGSNLFYFQLIIGLNLILFGFYTIYKKYKFLSYLFLTVGFIIVITTQYQLDNYILPLFKKVDKDSIVLIRTDKSLDLTVYEKYEYFTDYIYKSEERQDLFSIARTYNLFFKYNPLIIMDDCIADTYGFTSKYYLSTHEGISKMEVNRDFYVFNLFPTEHSKIYYIEFEHKGICEFREVFTIVNLVREYLDIDKFLLTRIE